VKSVELKETVMDFKYERRRYAYIEMVLYQMKASTKKKYQKVTNFRQKRVI
jgi:hypothetical protein